MPTAWHAWLDAHAGIAPLVCGLWWGLLWSIVWFGSAWVSSHWSQRIELALPFERTAPAMNWMIPVYASYDLVAVVLPLCCRGWRDYAALAGVILLQTGIACTIYMIVPQRLAFSTTQCGAVWDWASSATGLPHPGLYSYAPSMHVAGAIAMAFFFAPRLRPGARWLLWGWCVAVIASTWMVQEHHLADIASGTLLGLAVRPARR